MSRRQDALAAHAAATGLILDARLLDDAAVVVCGHALYPVAWADGNPGYQALMPGERAEARSLLEMLGLLVPGGKRPPRKSPTTVPGVVPQGPGRPVLRAHVRRGRAS